MGIHQSVYLGHCAMSIVDKPAYFNVYRINKINVFRTSFNKKAQHRADVANGWAGVELQELIKT